MKLFEVTNGYVGYSYVHVICVAESEAQAVELARERFKKGHAPSFCERLSVEELCADVSGGFCTEIYE